MSKRRFTEDSYRREPWFRGLCQAFTSCKTEEQVSDFLRDVATLSELQALSERLEVARELSQGLSYRQVSKNTGASTTTVTRVGSFLENGAGGYRKFLNAHRHHRMIRRDDASVESLLERKNLSIKNEHHHADSSKREERPASVLQKYLHKKQP